MNLTSQFSKSEDIIQQIGNEFERGEKLKKKVADLTDIIIIKRLAGSKFSEKFSYVNVKIFSDIVELYSLYQDELRESLHEIYFQENVKFYLIEVFLTEALLQKICTENWCINFTINYGQNSVCKTMKLQNKIPMFCIIPIDNNILNCTVETILFDNKNCNQIELSTVDIDISYHFKMVNSNKKTLNESEQIVKLSKLYNEYLNVKSLSKPFLTEYIFALHNVNPKNFVKAFLKNSFHVMDLEYFSVFENSNNMQKEFSIVVSTGNYKHLFIYNNELNQLKIKSNVKDLCNLKKYFYKELFVNDFHKGRGLFEIKEIKRDLRDNNILDILSTFQILRKSSSNA